MSMQNFIFRCDSNEKNTFMAEAEKMELDASFFLRRMVHLFLTDRIFRERVLTLVDSKEDLEWSF